MMCVYIFVIIYHSNKLSELLFIFRREDFLNLFYFLGLRFYSLGRQDEAEIFYLVFSLGALRGVYLRA